LTLKQFIESFKKIHHDCTITLLGSGTSVYYNDIAENVNEKMELKLLDIVVEVNKAPIFPEDRTYIIFDAVSVTTADDEDGSVPKIKWYFK